MIRILGYFLFKKVKIFKTKQEILEEYFKYKIMNKVKNTLYQINIIFSISGLAVSWKYNTNALGASQLITLK